MPTHERHSRIVPTTNHSLLVCKRFVRPPVPGSFDHQSQLCGFDPLVLPAKFESKTKATHRKSSTRKTSAVLYLVHNTQSGRRQLNPQSKFFYWQLPFRPFQNPNFVGHAETLHLKLDRNAGAFAKIRLLVLILATLVRRIVATLAPCPSRMCLTAEVTSVA